MCKNYINVDYLDSVRELAILDKQIINLEKDLNELLEANIDEYLFVTDEDCEQLGKLYIDLNELKSKREESYREFLSIAVK